MKRKGRNDTTDSIISDTKESEKQIEDTAATINLQY